MTRLNGWKRGCAVSVLCAVTAMASPGQTFTTLLSFDGTNGQGPGAELVQGTDGNFHGTTQYGGANGAGGTVFEITRRGRLKVGYSFCSQSQCTDGEYAEATLVQGTDGNFYGTTTSGGANLYYGTVFKITPHGQLTTLYSFCAHPNCTDGANPTAGLVQGTDGNFYGTTTSGGANLYYGTVFKITPHGQLTTLYKFCTQANCPDGFNPEAGLVQGTDGNFYGTTQGGGASRLYGTVFKVTPRGKLTTLHSFTREDGASPAAALVQGTDGKFYGTAPYGGDNGQGTVFKMTPKGSLTLLYSFCAQTNCTDGDIPIAGLVEGTDGNFYGTTFKGGDQYFYGVIFKITPAGQITKLYSFCSHTNCPDGTNPHGLVQGTDGNFYGTATSGGSSSNCDYGCGTVFRLATGLGSFVMTRPTSGKVGAAVIILGDNLTGTTGVTFNGTAATFTVVSKSEIKTAVPNGATS